jgi:hypothetical protein
VQKYDGTLTCRSYRTASGCATCFRVFLPVTAVAGESKSESDAQSVPRAAWQAV